ncbi:nucleotidyl transferase AbiEii/AbiGii toxin family protein [uncultured Hymenobacter sp.]|uniref:nucleotidyl transferase AbiEii/AbiGii toxin family protein n=1 Tax=uncultured Hymenobacter sp. TaxID=170016 RepID=UPI0035CBB709
MPNQNNLAALQAVARALGPLRERVVFVGGTTAGLYNTVPGAPESRPTEDVDCIIEVAPLSAYYEIEQELRELQFRNDQESAVICRWRYGELIVDIMPIEESILGFSNLWYREGFEHAMSFTLPDGTGIRILTAIYFLATKLAALKNRGMEDLRLSQDWEDIVYVLDNRPGLAREVETSTSAVKAYLQAEVAALLRHPELREALDCALPYGSGAGRVDTLEKRLRLIADLRLG